MPRNISGLRPAVKGAPSRNPKGRPPNFFNSQLKKLSANELEDIANLIVKGNYPALKELAKSKSATVIQVMLASACVKIIEKGDTYSLDCLLNRLVGKVKEEIKHTGITAPQIIAYMPDNGRKINTSNDEK